MSYDFCPEPLFMAAPASKHPGDRSRTDLVLHRTDLEPPASPPLGASGHWKLPGAWHGELAGLQTAPEEAKRSMGAGWIELLGTAWREQRRRLYGIYVFLNLQSLGSSR